jgi:hypothetical protein
MPGTLPPTLGVGLPKPHSAADANERLGLQEARVAKDSWARALDALERLQAAQVAQASSDAAKAEKQKDVSDHSMGD